MHEKVYAILSHVTFCSKARFVVRNTTIRFELVEQVQAVGASGGAPSRGEAGTAGGGGHLCK
jgi:hypothetical protein